MLSVVLAGSILIGAITAFLNARGIDDMMSKTLGPATQMAADAVEWRMDAYWAALQEAAASDIFRECGPTAPKLVPVRDGIAQRNGFLYTGKMDASGLSSTGYSYAGEDYFEQCKATMEPYISDIMNDGQRMIFLLEVPIITDGRFEGVVYGGISADFLSDIVVNLAMGSEGVAYVLDRRGNVIGHRERAVVEEGSNMIEAAKTDSSAADIAAVNQRMIQGETGFRSYNFYGDNKFVGFAPIGGSQEWSIAIETSQREFKSTLDRRSILLTVLVVALVVIAAFPVAVKVGRSISGPIQSCVTRLEKLAEGDPQLSAGYAPPNQPVRRNGGGRRRPGVQRSAVPEPGGHNAGQRRSRALRHRRQHRGECKADRGGNGGSGSLCQPGRRTARRQRRACKGAERRDGKNFKLRQ